MTQSSDPTWIPIQLDPREKRIAGVARHGNTPFSAPYISHVSGNLWQGGCVSGLILPTHILHLFSLYPWESYTVNHEMKTNKQVYMYDSEDQAMDQVDEIAREVYAAVQDAPTLVHCQAGLNRSGLIAARVLMLSGLSAEEAIATLRGSRSPAVLCNRAFEDWLLENPVG